MNITQIAGNVNRGFLRGNRYKVFLVPPPAVSGGYDLRLVGENCVDVGLPGATFGTFNWSNSGPVLKMPYQMIFEEVKMEFYVDVAANASKFFREWNRAVMDDNFKFRYFDQYTADIRIEEYDCNNTRRTGCTVKNAYCSGIDPVRLSYENKNQIERISVSFAYEYYKYD